MRGISSIAEDMLPTQERIRCMELVYFDEITGTLTQSRDIRAYIISWYDTLLTSKTAILHLLFTVSFQQPPSTMRANSALPVTIRVRPVQVRDSAATPAGNTSGNTPFNGPSRENNRPKAITVQHT